MAHPLMEVGDMSGSGGANPVVPASEDENSSLVQPPQPGACHCQVCGAWCPQRKRVCLGLEHRYGMEWD